MPYDTAGPIPCARCGHTLWQHSTGMCDLKGCECQGWCATLPAEPVEDPSEAQRRTAWIVVLVALLFAVVCL